MSQIHKRELSEKERIYPLSHGGVVVYAANGITELYPQETKFVYFIVNAHLGMVKIGIAADFEARLKELQTSSPHPLSVVAVITGGHAKEAELHRRYDHLRMHGEWFRLEGTLVDLIKDLQFAWKQHKAEAANE